MTTVAAPPHDPAERPAERPDEHAAGLPAGHSVAMAYEGTVTHVRARPFRVFAPKLFLAYLDLDALPDSLDRLPLWSARHRAVIRFRRHDFFDAGTQPLGDAVRDLVATQLGRRPVGRIFLLAHLRTFGWLFNPLAVYYCWSTDGATLDAVVLEVSNTPWGERHWYVLDARGSTNTAVTPKEMHVSPFLPMAVDYRISWTVPGVDLHLRIDVQRGERRIFHAELNLALRPLDRRHAITLLARYPLLPARVSLGIHREAVRLWLRRVPIIGHVRQPRGASS